MKSDQHIVSQTTQCEARFSRRDFLGTCTACAAGLGAAALLGVTPAGGQTMPACPKAKVRLVFSHIPPGSPTWPNIGYDYEGRKRQVTQKLRQACPDIEFLPATAHNGAEAQKILESDKEVDGYLCHMTGIWTGVPQAIAATGRPTVFADDLYGGSGEFLVAYAAARRNGWKVAGVSSNDFGDVAQAARCFSCMKKLQHSNILRIGSGFGCSPEGVEKVFGTRTILKDHKELNKYYEKADKAEARQWADRWIGRARKVVEPTPGEIVKSGAMYLGMREMMDEHKAQAITVNCLGGFYGGHITAYPCLGFFQLNDDGYVGACESDLKSTITMLLMGYLTGRPGYISDPVIDTSKNQIIYAHCVAPSKVYGPDGKTNPYDIRNHSEDRKGAAVRSLMPLGEMTTTLEFDPDKKQVILHQARTVENIDEDKACRTKLAAEPVGDIDKLFDHWDTWGWHRVTFYGDLKRPVEHMAALLGFEVIEEA
ncbi:MAG: twin-arginine translocation signal domain-containing protein [Sedimentisphaerales bacterium]|nr:twin-arginine translocation signal domain-containing protein [Sedimentisphaerales bacterium]